MDWTVGGIIAILVFAIVVYKLATHKPKKSPPPTYEPPPRPGPGDRAGGGSKDE